LPIAILIIAFYVGSLAWTMLISFTSSDVTPIYDTVGFQQYARLFGSTRWWTTAGNLAIYVLISVFGSVGLGYALAIGLHRGVTGQAPIKLILLLPLSTSFVATGAVWQGLFDPVVGIQHAVRSWGFPNFAFVGLSDPHTVMLVLAAAGIWQQTGLCMSLFVVGLSRVDPSIWRALSVDGANAWQRYVVVAGPGMARFFLLAILIVGATGLRTYDLVVVLTSGGPGFSSDVPAHFVIEQIMERQDLGLGSAGACVMLAVALAVALPYMLLALRRTGS
jgi:glucose/mannose transport system permease protein